MTRAALASMVEPDDASLVKSREDYRRVRLTKAEAVALGELTTREVGAVEYRTARGEIFGHLRERRLARLKLALPVRLRARTSVGLEGRVNGGKGLAKLRPAGAKPVDHGLRGCELLLDSLESFANWRGEPVKLVGDRQR